MEERRFIYVVLSAFKEHWNKRQLTIAILLYSFIDRNSEERNPELALYILKNL